MKIVFPAIANVFDSDIGAVNTIIIENQSLFSEICMDIYNQSLGNDGQIIVSIDDKPVDLAKNAELISQFVPFEINKKGLISKLSARAEKIANEPDYYETTMTAIAALEKYVWDLSDNLVGNIRLAKMSIGNIVKAIGMEFDDDYPTLGEKIIDYMELVREYDKDKLFIFVNLRSFISDREAESFFDTVLRKQFHIVLIENSEHEHFSNEKCYIVDKNCCEIQ